MFTQKTPLILGLLVLTFWGAGQLTGTDLQGRLNRGEKGAEKELVDLAVTDVKMSPEHLEVVLSNQGKQDISEQSDLKLRVEAGSSASWTLSLLNHKDLYKAGATVTLQLEPVAGVDRITACVDSENKLKESKEDNNCGTRDLSEDSAKDEDQKPDLYVSRISLNAENQLVLEVGNRGQADVLIRDGYTVLEVDGQIKWTGSWAQLADQNFLKKGGQSSFTVGAWTGSDVVKACIDTTERVQELDENNCLDWKPVQP